MWYVKEGRGMIQALLWFWQFPQHLLALIILRVFKATYAQNQPYPGKSIYTVKKFIGVSLGNCIIVNENASELTIKHEYGHSRQSVWLGPLYLLVIGIPSAIFNNLWDRLFHKKWKITKRLKWYYGRFPENWADKLGSVTRTFNSGER